MRIKPFNEQLTQEHSTSTVCQQNHIVIPEHEPCHEINENIFETNKNNYTSPLIPCDNDNVEATAIISKNFQNDTYKIKKKYNLRF